MLLRFMRMSRDCAAEDHPWLAILLLERTTLESMTWFRGTYDGIIGITGGLLFVFVFVSLFNVTDNGELFFKDTTE